MNEHEDRQENGSRNWASSVLMRGTTVNIKVSDSGLAVAGLVLSLVSFVLLLLSIPVLSLLFWPIAAVLSYIGWRCSPEKGPLSTRYRGIAVAGLCISLFVHIVFMYYVGRI